jgi:methylmalonyl-CoA/ethylmalonyl-CoA epimerase
MKMMTLTLLAVLLAASIHAQNAPKQTKEQDKMSESTGFALNKVGQISVGVKDLDRATEFYRDKLGVKHLLKAPSVSVFNCGGITLLLSLADSNTSIIYFEVDDIQKAFETLKSRGVKMEEKPHVVGQLGKMDVWIAIFRDSEENLMSLKSTIPTAKAR